jgi:lysophospholipase L1-like esterase
MSVYGSDRYPRMGWGQPLGELFAEQCAKVDDRAISGRSSKSFSDEGHWAPVRDALQSGDYVLIQFGHNDEKREDPSRFTEPVPTYKQYLTSYVTDTRAHLATPVLLTSIERNQWTGSTLKDSHGPYSVAVRELAHSLHVELIDLTALSKAYFERLGPERTGELFMNLAPGKYPGYPDGSSDNTHLQEGGARLIGLVAMADAYRQKLALARYLKAVPLAP